MYFQILLLIFYNLSVVKSRAMYLQSGLRKYMLWLLTCSMVFCRYCFAIVLVMANILELAE